jgi:hypothetical protein
VAPRAWPPNEFYRITDTIGHALIVRRSPLFLASAEVSERGRFSEKGRGCVVFVPFGALREVAAGLDVGEPAAREWWYPSLGDRN